ncbi:MAG: MFS transporter [Chloroflexota bacterium]|nr:MFS transporter [Chloroflexota bacterium]
MRINTAIRQATYPIAILGERNFALVWSSVWTVQTGNQMEALILAWYVLEVTGSPLLVGLIASARMGLNFLAIFSGAIADRLPRHRLLAFVELVMTCFGASVLILMLTGFLQVWHLFAITLSAGLVRIFQMPSAQALIGDTLPPDKISNGAALSSMAQNLSTILGPFVGGLLYKTWGPEGGYIGVALLYFTSSICAFFVRPVRVTESQPRGSVLGTVMEGLRYVKGQQVLWATLAIAVIINLTGWPFHTALLAIFASNVLETGPDGLGLLTASFGIGALAGSLGWATFRNLQHIGKLMILSVVVWHGSMLVFALSSNLYLSLAILLVTGLAFSSTQVMMLTAMLRTTQADYRGRVLGLRVLAIYAYAFGGAGAGFLAGLWGAPIAAVTIGLAGIVMTCSLVVFTPQLRRA